MSLALDGIVVTVPDVPVSVNGTVPVVAALVAVSSSVLAVLAGFGLKAALTPLGRPDAARVTVPVKPSCGAIVIALVPLDPRITVRLPGDADSVKLPTVGGGSTFTTTLSVAVAPSSSVTSSVRLWTPTDNHTAAVAPKPMDVPPSRHT